MKIIGVESDAGLGSMNQVVFRLISVDLSQTSKRPDKKLDIFPLLNCLGVAAALDFMKIICVKGDVRLGSINQVFFR
jgi:hypothetical protein